jgi:hypothetical protein
VLLHEEPVALDDAGPLGFSAAEVIEHVGMRTYAGAEPVEYDDPGREGRSNQLLAEAPFVLSTLDDPTAYVRETNLGGSGSYSSLWIEGTVEIASASGEFATTGRLMLEATTLSDDGIHWAAETSLDGATGTMPQWVHDGVDDAWDDTFCSNTSPEIEADDAFVWLVLNGPVARPQLLVGATWEPPFADCGATATVAGVALIP